MDALSVLPVAPTREQIERLEAAMLDMESAAGIQLETWHEFAAGLVARTIQIPAGTVLTGAVHRSEHLNVCHGDITVWTERGMRRLRGYHVLPALGGAKRVGLAHEDTYWTTIHLNPTDTRDLAELEDALVEDADRLQSRRLARLPQPQPAEALA